MWKKSVKAEEMAEKLDLDLETVKERATKRKSLAELMGVKRKRAKGETGEDMSVDSEDED